MKRKIVVLTGTRADYGLLKKVIKGISEHKELSLCLVVTGSHLSHYYGHTVNEIESDGPPISYRLPILEKAESQLDVIEASSKIHRKFGEVLLKEKPAMVLLLGDRYEAFQAAAAAVVLNVPLAHIHGGELTLGAIDDAFRHAITKMSWWHFATAEVYRQRIITLGEDPLRVFNTGAPAVDSLDEAKVKVEELEIFLGLKFKRPLILATIHPETLNLQNTESNIREVFDALKSFGKGTVIFTKANADAQGHYINEELEKYFHSSDAPYGRLVDSLGHIRYLSLLRECDVALGNSSSLVIEAPMLGVPSVNIGMRQKGRVRAPSVIDVPFKASEILNALNTASTSEFKSDISKDSHPFGSSGVAERIVSILAKAPLPENLTKDFYE